MSDEWGARLRFAAMINIPPAAFWRLSWREWRMLTHAPEPEVLSRASLETLMQKFPDEEA